MFRARTGNALRLCVGLNKSLSAILASSNFEICENNRYSLVGKVDIFRKVLENCTVREPLREWLIHVDVIRYKRALVTKDKYKICFLRFV